MQRIYLKRTLYEGTKLIHHALQPRRFSINFLKLNDFIRVRCKAPFFLRRCTQRQKSLTHSSVNPPRSKEKYSLAFSMLLQLQGFTQKEFTSFTRIRSYTVSSEVQQLFGTSVRMFVMQFPLFSFKPEFFSELFKQISMRCKTTSHQVETNRVDFLLYHTTIYDSSPHWQLLVKLVN